MGEKPITATKPSYPKTYSSMTYNIVPNPNQSDGAKDHSCRCTIKLNLCQSASATLEPSAPNSYILNNMQ